jgi:DNA-binding NtrC family response regulator
VGSSAAPGAGAVRSARWFEAARHGTLFLDEIADLPAILQGQLLRQLQEQEAAQAGSHDLVRTDVRLIAATRVDLGEAVSAGHFRLELFYRLNVGQVRLRPLRERRADVAALAAHFLRIHARRLNMPLPQLSQQALAALTQYSWPGNIRELENVIRFALLITSDRELQIEHLKLGGTPGSAHAPESTQIAAPRLSDEQTPSSLNQLLEPLFQTPGKRLLSDLESLIVGEAFRFTGCNQVRTAALLGISRNVLRTLLRKHGLLVVRRRKLLRAGGHG